MTRKKRTPFALSKDNKLFVEVSAIMNPLCSLVDGLPLTFFGKDREAYIDVDTAIKWCQEEGKHHSQKKYAKMIEILEKAKKEAPLNVVED